MNDCESCIHYPPSVMGNKPCGICYPETPGMSFYQEKEKEEDPMDKKTVDKLSGAIVDFLDELIRIADEENYDRDLFVNAGADMFQAMATISTFKNFKRRDENA